LKNLSAKEMQFYWRIFYAYSVKGIKAKLRPLWYAIQCELERCKLQEKYIEHAHKKRYALADGTILTKTYKGRTYQVTVKGEKEYEWNGEIFPNLTAVAEKIVRSHVSGPKFFGLTGRHYVKD
ncbi:MAG: DUF2924 domain-containing protein, partial [Elusimicrobiaceae bacterium]|nr:DUF2924 domain-containing protein [Elusimicrobiaceae bacterium]